MAKNEPKYTKEGLPVVTPGVINSLGADITNSLVTGDDLTKNLTDLIEKENSCIMALIDLIRSTTLYEETKECILYTGIAVYNALRKQAESYKIEKEFKE